MSHKRKAEGSPGDEKKAKVPRTETKGETKRVERCFPADLNPAKVLALSLGGASSVTQGVITSVTGIRWCVQTRQ
jgi:hypothetical protein